MSAINFHAPPTVGRFMRSDAFIRVIAGPVGSGKTTGCIFEVLRRAIEQAPSPDGIRHSRWAIVRQTLQQLRMTVLLDILTWLRPIATYKVSEQLIILRFGDVRAEIFLIPLEDPEDQKRLLSMQLTGAWISEAIEIDADLVPALAGRVGRYPSKADGGPTWFGIIADTNMPTIGSPWWELMDSKTPPDWQVHIQPGGLETDAENIENLPGGVEYYRRLARGNNAAWIERYVHAKYGEDPSGTAVWKSFRRIFHVSAKTLTPSYGQMLLVGQDFGRNPCSLICQPDTRGRLLILEEVIGEDIGIEMHVVMSLKPRLWSSRYMGMMVMAIGDPSGAAKDSREESMFDIMSRLGIPTFRAPTNDLEPRISSVESVLLQQRDGGPAILIDEARCPNLIRGMQGAYRYGKTKAGESKPLPDKSHPYSDLADALQYVTMAWNTGLTGYYARKIVGRRQRNEDRMPASAWT